MSDNRDVYHLRDAMGGHTGLLLDHDADLSTPSQASFSVYDAFGNGMSPGSPSGLAGSFAWRGGEGSVRDAAPNLVYMQARHYDPTIGRFIQPDTMTLASTTTQGMNKYIYCENDPVNMSDPLGRFVPAVFFGIAFVIGMILGGLTATTMFEGLSSLGFALRALVGYTFLAPMKQTIGAQCNIAFKAQDAMLADLLSRGLISVNMYLSLIMRTGFGFVGLGFAIGFAAGFALTTLLLMVRREDKDEQLDFQGIHNALICPMWRDWKGPTEVPFVLA